jgi:hypothetical protein
MRRLLIISPYFPPSAASGAFRMLGFARHLPKQNWEAAFVACGPLPWQADDPGLLKQVPPETRVRYVDFPLKRQRSYWALILQRLKVFRGMYLWNAPALRACRKMIDEFRPDAILTSGPPHTVHLIGRALQRRYRLPWVADFRDPWCSWGQELHYGRKYGGVSKYLEGRVFRDAELVIANTDRTAEMFREVYPESASRIIAIPNGYEPFEAAESNDNGLDSDTFKIVHTGAIYVGRDPRPVAEAIAAINDERSASERKLHMKLLGPCLDSELQRDLDANGHSKYVELQPHVPHREAAQAMQSADMLLLLDTPGRRIGVPAKLYEYIGAKRPILALAEGDGDTALVLEKSGLPHVAASDWTAANLRRAILGLVNGSQSSAECENGVAAADFTRGAAATQLATALNQLISR